MRQFTTHAAATSAAYFQTVKEPSKLEVFKQNNEIRTAFVDALGELISTVMDEALPLEGSAVYITVEDFRVTINGTFKD